MRSLRFVFFYVCDCAKILLSSAPLLFRHFTDLQLKKQFVEILNSFFSECLYVYKEL